MHDLSLDTSDGSTACHPLTKKSTLTAQSRNGQAKPGATGGNDAMQHATTGADPAWVRASASTIGAIDFICRWSGHIVAIATLATVIFCFGTVYLRYVMGAGLIWLQEAYVWTHVIVDRAGCRLHHDDGRICAGGCVLFQLVQPQTRHV
jgi:hypothetical protein